MPIVGPELEAVRDEISPELVSGLEFCELLSDALFMELAEGERAGVELKVELSFRLELNEVGGYDS